MEAANTEKAIAHEIGGIQNDTFRFGLHSVKSDVVGSHPLQSAYQSTKEVQEQMKRRILLNTYGSALPLKMDLDRQMLSRFQRLPGPIPSSMLGLEALTGSLDGFGFEDYLSDPQQTRIPYVGLNFSVYESLKDWLIKTRPFGLVEDSELSVTTKLACGAAAGTVGQTVAYPLDVIRRRMQMVGWKDAASLVTGDGKSKAPLEYSGMVDAFRKTVRHEGFRALYKGLVPNSVKVVPSIAIAFVTYEAVKDVLGVEMKISD
ncbi:hypothetical protein TEA_027840 [Camellia sinensis var. sinensis]|uniref:Uncharacterized protein n=1 Tax=Camellia sinensis var. sinensis TaxID=542762 RepID=A0A4S4DY45_CAMSN|nr:hypothetical protein TEA_027840 [Camellia sinensis var. sinensis]